MSNWAEIVAGAEKFEGIAEGRAQIRREELAREREVERGSKLQQGRQELRQTRAIFQKLQVGGALEAVRDEIWGEGKINYTGGVLRYSTVAGREIRHRQYALELTSDTYPVLEPNNGILLTAARTRLVVVVSFPLTGEKKTPHVDVADEFCFGAPRGNIDLARFLKDDRRRGLDDVFSLVHSLGKMDDYHKFTVDPDDEYAKEQFFSAIKQGVDRRIKNESLPQQIRDKTLEVVAQFPLALQERGFMRKPELQRWIHTLRGSHPMVVALDRVRGLSA